MSWFHKPDILQKVKSELAFCKLDLTDKENILSYNNKINIGCGATKVINNKICTGTATSSEISKYKKECLIFLSKIFDKIFEPSPLKYSLTKYASSLSATNMVSKPDILANRFKSLCYSLCKVKKLVLKTVT